MKLHDIGEKTIKLDPWVIPGERLPAIGEYVLVWPKEEDAKLPVIMYICKFVCNNIDSDPTFHFIFSAMYDENLEFQVTDIEALCNYYLEETYDETERITTL